MRAMLLDRPCSVGELPLRLADLPRPDPGPGELRVQVRCCGVCHTDLHIVEGDLSLPALPIVPGHQVAGVVHACGPGTSRFSAGDRVGIPWLYSTCGRCQYCRGGLENLCETARFTGFHVQGGYAEFITVREDFAYRLPEGFSDRHVAPLLCAGVIGYRSFRLSGARSGSRLGLYGFGASAHLVLQFARHLGCEVYVFTRSPAHREHARSLGAAWTGAAGDALPCPLDAAIIFAPAGSLVPAALAALRKGGTLALAGITMSPLPQMDYSLLYHERSIRSVANSTRQDVRDFLELAATIPLRTEVQAFPLEEANRALQAVKNSQVNGAAVLEISKPE